MCGTRVRDARAWRDVEVMHTLDGNVNCVLHTCMTFEAAPGIARKASVDACYCKRMTCNFGCSVHAQQCPCTQFDQVRVNECAALTQLRLSLAGLSWRPGYGHTRSDQESRQLEGFPEKYF